MSQVSQAILAMYIQLCHTCTVDGVRGRFPISNQEALLCHALHLAAQVDCLACSLSGDNVDFSSLWTTISCLLVRWSLVQECPKLSLAILKEKVIHCPAIQT